MVKKLPGKRGYIHWTAVLVAAAWALFAQITGNAASQPAEHFQGDRKFQQIIAEAKAGKWAALPIGELMGKIAVQLQGIPYRSGTLELSSDREICSVNLEALDCVTFFETTLDMARMLKEGGSTPADLLRQVSHSRYRGGVVGDYSTRLHYMSGWLIDNQSRGIVKVLSNLPGSEPFKPTVDFLSTHPQASIQLKAHPELIEKIKRAEQDVGKMTLSLVPIARLGAVEPLLKTGDIVAIVSNQDGLDISHTGLVIRTADGVAHFMDASSRKAVMRVTLEPGSIGDTLKRFTHSPGVIFARPLEPQ